LWFEVVRAAGALLGRVRLTRLLYFAAVLLASDEALDAGLRALVPEMAVLVLADLLVPDLLLVVGVRRDPRRWPAHRESWPELNADDTTPRRFAQRLNRPH
jgi:hypothetical protein